MSRLASAFTIEGSHVNLLTFLWRGNSEQLKVEFPGSACVH